MNDRQQPRAARARGWVAVGAIAALRCSAPLDFGGVPDVPRGADAGGAVAAGILECPTVAPPPYTLAGEGRLAPESANAEDRRAVLARGLALFRKPDASGTACANCHSPDGIELAVVAYTDADVLRHTTLRLTDAEARDVVDYVHALRATHVIERPCSKLWRPFQPGGEPLPGATARERDAAFAAELARRGLLITTTPIRTLAEAKAAATELEAVDLRRLPLPVAFPRLAEDAADGPEHRSFHDWIPGAGRIPKDPGTWYARADRYLANPTLENLSAIDLAIDDETTRSTADSQGRPITADFSVAYNAQGWMEETLRLKYKALLLASHLFRMALLGQPGWFDRPPLPFPELPRAYGPFFHMGLLNAESPCYGNAECDAAVTARLPAFMKEEFGPTTVGDMAMNVLSDPWACMGELQDASLLSAQNFRGVTQTGFYWNIYTFQHRFVQQPFFDVHRIVTQQAYAAKYRGTFRYPAVLDAAARSGEPTTAPLVELPDGTTPLLDGQWMRFEGLTSIRSEADDPRLPMAVFLRANAGSMLLLLQRDLLAGGAKVASKSDLVSQLDGPRSIASQVEELLGDAAWAAAHPTLREAATTFTTDLRALADEVEAAIRAAPELPGR